jgi:hypothetical protein
MVALTKNRAIAQAVSRRLPTAEADLKPRSNHVECLVAKMALVQVLSEYFSFLSEF